MMDRTATDSAERPTAVGLAAEGIVKRYASVPALDGVSVAVRPGIVTGLVGHNGAGKSTLLKVLSGAIVPDEGRVTVDGDGLGRQGPAEALRRGVSTVYQELSLLENLTVTENVFLGREQRRRGMLDRPAMRRSARTLLERFDIAADVDVRLREYPIATRQLLEIAVAIGRRAKYLLLDEPTTSLEGAQISRFLELVKTLARDSGLGILLVDHKLEELYEVADRIVALVDGQVRIEGTADGVDRDEIVRAIAGEEVAIGIHERTGGPTAVSTRPQVEHAPTPALRVTNLRTPTLRDVTVQVRAGRILGLYGLIGSGRTEFLRSLVGLETILGGRIEVFGQAFSCDSPRDSQRVGLVYLTEDRKVDGIVAGLDSTTNVVLPILSECSRFGVLDRRRLAQRATEQMDRLHLRGNRDAPVVGLSGGNQQKVLLARALVQQPRILLLDEPTKGVDIGVKVEIHRLLRTLAHEQGMAIVLVSSEEDEILEVADDVCTFVHGTCDGRETPSGDLSISRLRHSAWRAA